tara:strand:+ start:54 stop:710 length:657 start_codon:yes stop_codon:yes gene_type:complete
MVRDSQRSKVYKWENEMFSNEISTKPVWSEEQCIKFINESYKWFINGNENTPAINIKFLNGFNTQSSSYYCNDDNLIGLQKLHTNPIVCLHELAHFIDGNHVNVDCDFAGHSEVFVSIYIKLLGKFTDFTKSQLIESLKNFNINYLDLMNIPDSTYIPNLNVEDLKKQKYIHYTAYSYDSKKWIPIDPNNINEYRNDDYAFIDPNNTSKTVHGYELTF